MGESVICAEMASDVNFEKDNTSDNEFLVAGTQQEAFPYRKEAKEASTEGIKSEVSSPRVSPRENASSCHEISSHWSDLLRSYQVGRGRETYTSSGSSSPVEALSEEEPPISENTGAHVSIPQNDNPGSVSVCHAVLSILKHVSSSGIRRITLTISERNEDYDTQTATSVAEPATSAIDRGVSYTEEDARNYSSCNHSGGEVSGSMDDCRYDSNMESKICKKVVRHNYPSNVRKLLSTGILDGARLKYVSLSPAVYEFEQHAGFKTRHPNNHIHLENGRPIYSIIQEVKTAPPSMLDEVVKGMAVSSINEEFFQVCKASLQPTNQKVGPDTRHYSKLPLPYFFLSQPNQTLGGSGWPTSSFFYTASLSEHFYEYFRRAETCIEALFLCKDQAPINLGWWLNKKKTPEGGSKRRDNDLHRLLFMPDGLSDGAELAYHVKGHKILGGYKHGNGIFCNCCETEISPSQFEAHAGMAARRQPYRHIYSSNGLTLHDIAISLKNGKSLTASVNVDMCTKCGDGGNLICCETCPQAFHPSCLDLQSVAKASWCCPNCNKFGHGAKSIIIQSTGVVKSLESGIGGCAICRGHDFQAQTFGDRTVIYCDQCEKEFHIGCLRDSGRCDLKEVPKDDWFCCDYLQMIPSELLDIINRKHAERGLLLDEAAGDVQWRILMGKSRIRRDLLSAATAVFQECFGPIVAKSGHDLIPVMVYGRNISGQEFGNMYCVLLTVKGAVVSAGLLRVFGREVAELPLIATCKEHQCLFLIFPKMRCRCFGYFQALFSSIERLLCFLNVENLVLPAAKEAESIWTNKFGFRKMSEAQLLRYTRDFQLTIFKDTSMLEKEVPTSNSSK
ncbi:hypothetical protein K2173_019621 [Erythroxylum novogranatense]|uniref:PHD-type domain-containing protein n=1 Tax=Erythroxylum novogranatense TaxID=1862640 RepID=A0AAV8UFA6_9ROSI|nr:hypothetical protein K2173_019621 [Erythroxylum novogranatense]